MNICLKKLIKDFGLDDLEVGRVLFPASHHPTNALRRVKNYKQDLDSRQIFRLCETFNIPIEEVFNKSWLVAKTDLSNIHMMSGVRLYRNPEGTDSLLTYRDVMFHVGADDDIEASMTLIKAAYKKKVRDAIKKRVH